MPAATQKEGDYAADVAGCLIRISLQGDLELVVCITRCPPSPLLCQLHFCGAERFDVELCL